MFISATLYKRVIDVYFVLVALITGAYALLFTRTSRDWVIADWLINYSGGFVRRGLPGELALLLSHALHIPILFFPALLCLCFYAIYLGAAWAIVRSSTPGVWSLALALSPATFNYQIMDMGGGGRKEIIYLAALALLLLLLRRALSARAVVVYLACWLVVGTFSHELIFFYAPYFVPALVLAGRTLGQSLRLVALPMVLSLGALLVCAAHPGTFALETRVCSSIGQTISPVKSPSQICGAGGAMSYLATSREAARAEADSTERKDNYYTLYPLMGVLALVPLVGCSLWLRREQQGSRLPLLWATAAFSFAISLPLFLFAIDWGRWIYIHIVSLALLLLFASGRERVSAPEPAGGDLAGFRLRPYALLLLALYAGAWSLPHANGTAASAKLGYLDVWRDLQLRLHRHT